MKKVLVALFALTVAATVATAGVGITWSVSWGAYDHASPDVTGGSNALLDSYSAIWQLIYAGANNVADPIPDPATSAPGLGGAGIADDYVYGDDVVWAERNIAVGGGSAGDGTTWDNWMLWQTGTPFYENLSWNTAGFVYQRVFESTPANGTYYFQTPLLALDTTYATGGTGQDFYVDPSGTGGFQPNQQIHVVPEPATMSLLGLGALVMAIRRRRA